jgi:hypothetical protein
MKFYEILQTIGLVEELKSFATPDRSSNEVREWLAERMGVPIHKIPKCINRIRGRFECRAKHGGVRPRGEKFYQVRSRNVTYSQQ